MKSIVIYYSRSGYNYVNGEIKNLQIGNVETIANKIAEITNSDTFKIEQIEEYSNDYSECIDEAKKDQRENARPKLKNMPKDLQEYDVVYIGYPIWWGIAAWPVDTFVKANDFNGKTVIPFCTSSSSSGLGQSGELLAEEANGGDWLEGHRFRSNPSDSDINNWTDSLK
mgnify:CR=1 FL=1